MKKLKTYTTPLDLFVIGANITKTKEDEEACILITDDYCSGGIKGNKNTDFWIETEGYMVLLTQEQFDKALKECEDADFSEETGVVEFKAFTGDIYVRLLENGVDCLKEDPDMDEYLVYEYREDLPNEWRDVELLFSGNYTFSCKKELKDYL